MGAAQQASPFFPRCQSHTQRYLLSWVIWMCIEKEIAAVCRQQGFFFTIHIVKFHYMESQIIDGFPPPWGRGGLKINVPPHDAQSGGDK